jgi:hypothetical protein
MHTRHSNCPTRHYSFVDMQSHYSSASSPLSHTRMQLCSISHKIHSHMQESLFSVAPLFPPWKMLPPHQILLPPLVPSSPQLTTNAQNQHDLGGAMEEISSTKDCCCRWKFFFAFRSSSHSASVSGFPLASFIAAEYLVVALI